jgi:hypothetical protein
MYDGFHTLMKDHIKLSLARRKGQNVMCNAAQIFFDAKKSHYITIMQKHPTLKDAFGELYSESIVFRINNKVRLIHHS